MFKSFRLLLIIVIVAGLAAGAAFGAGTVYGRTLGAKPATTSATGTSAQSPAGGGLSASATGIDAAARGGIRGSIESVEGDVIGIKGLDGSVTKMKIDSKTSIRKTVDGVKDDLQIGVNVTVAGDRGADGTVAATQVSIVPTGGTGLGTGTGVTPSGRPTTAADATPGAASTPGGPGGGRRSDPNATPPAGR